MSLNRWAQGKIILAEFATLMRGRIEPALPGDVELAAALVRVLPGLNARDLVHLAIMQRVGADTLVSADRGFDRAPSIRRLDPADVETWSSQVGR
jgi:predicted nucleic acid-binding protein